MEKLKLSQQQLENKSEDIIKVIENNDYSKLEDDDRSILPIVIAAFVPMIILLLLFNV